MNRQQHAGVKVTYIETQFVTSDDAAGFKDLVQRLTGKSPTAATGTGAAAAPASPHRPRASRAAGAGMTPVAGGAAGPPQGYGYRPTPPGEVRCYPAAAVASRAPPCQEELLLGMDDFSDLFYGAGTIDQRRHCLNGGYVDSTYY